MTGALGSSRPKRAFAPGNLGSAGLLVVKLQDEQFDGANCENLPVWWRLNRVDNGIRTEFAALAAVAMLAEI